MVTGDKITDLTAETTIALTDLFEMTIDPAGTPVSRKVALSDISDTIFAGADTDDLAEGSTNLYYSEALVSANTSVAANTAKTGVTTQISNVSEDTSPTSGGDFDFANFNAENVAFASFNETDDGNSGAADTIDFSAGAFHKSTLTASTTYTTTAPFTGGTDYARLQMIIHQDGTGAWDITWPATWTWPDGEPTWTDGTANQKIMVTAVYDDGEDEYVAQATAWYT